jgi:hypothetical protein
MKHITLILCINIDKNVTPIMQIYVLIFNVGKYNIHMNIFYNPWSFPMVCILFTSLVLSFTFTNNHLNSK